MLHPLPGYTNWGFWQGIFIFISFIKLELLSDINEIEDAEVHAP
jgi:hypothetical protein